METLSLQKPELDEHSRKLLEAGAKPIFVCVGTYADFSKFDIKGNLKNNKLNSIKRDFRERSGTTSHDVDWSTRAFYKYDRKFLTAGDKSYIISPIDDKDKFSEDFMRCLGLVTVGTNKKTGKNISFMSHQDPKYFLYENKKRFVDHLEQRLHDFRKICKPNTIDAVLGGGLFVDRDDDEGHSILTRHHDAVRLLTEEVQKILDFKPVIVNGPKFKELDSDNMYFDNENRRLYFQRVEVNGDIGDNTLPD